MEKGLEILKDYRALLGFVTENEMVVGHASVNDELKAKMHFLNVGYKFLNKQSTKALILRGSEHERL